ncbi:hypothetical protein C8T65DRAFT_664933 [Cerioporus squamosus]|nr:hypothetical protein C8T65DRAFT_664933 [Cerioporus squamosus]
MADLEGTIVYSSFSEKTFAWPASVLSVIAFLQRVALPSALDKICGSDNSPPASAAGSVVPDEPMSSLLHQSLNSATSPDKQDDAQKLRQCYRTGLRDPWKYLVSEIVKESIPDATVYHNCSFARSRYGTVHSGDFPDDIYGEATSLIMVPTSVHPVLSDDSGDCGDGQEIVENCDERTNILSSYDDGTKDGPDSGRTTGEDDAGQVEVFEDDDVVDSSQGSGDSAEDGTSEEPQSEVEQDAPTNQENDADRFESDCSDCEPIPSYRTLLHQLYDSLPSNYVHLHLLATPFHPLPLVPILCVADEQNIIALMISAVSQRKALGMNLPVIGILYPTSGSVFSVLVAWRDDSTPAPVFHVLISIEGDLPSVGVFDLEHSASLYSFTEFLRLASAQVVDVLDQETRQHSISSFSERCAWRVDDSRDHELESPWRVDIARWSRHVCDSAKACIWSEMSEAVAMDTLLFMQTGSWSPERELYGEGEAALIDLEHPGIAAWSLDYHVLTIGLNRGGVVHAEFATVFDGIYNILYPQEVDTPLRSAVPIIGGLLEAMFHSDHDEAARNAFLVWRALMSWAFGSDSEAFPDAFLRLEFTTAIHTPRCPEYDRVAPSLPDAQMPHVGFADIANDHDSLTYNDWDQFVMANEGPTMSLAENCRPASQELTSTWRHMERMYDTIRAVFKVSASDTETVVQIEKLADRLTQYPLGVRLDAAISAVDLDFLVEAGTGTRRDFIQEICLFRDDGLDDGAFRLPVLLIKHQVQGPDLDVITRNALRLCCVSAAHFLAVLGIKDFPVYGLITTGHYGYVSAAWCSDSDGVLYIADHNTAQYRFDLSTKEGAVRFIGFLQGLLHHAAELKARFASVRGQLLTRMSTAEGRAALWWTLRSQIDEHNLQP